MGKAKLRAHATFGDTHLPLRSCMASLKQGWSRGSLPSQWAEPARWLWARAV